MTHHPLQLLYKAIAEKKALREALGGRIAEARKSVGMTASELARRIGLTRSAVAQWESATTEPSDENLDKIADILASAANWASHGVRG